MAGEAQPKKRKVAGMAVGDRGRLSHVVGPDPEDSENLICYFTGRQERKTHSVPLVELLESKRGRRLHSDYLGIDAEEADPMKRKFESIGSIGNIIDYVSETIWVRILVYLDVTSLAAAMRVSKAMHWNCHLDPIWRATLHRTWGTWLREQREPPPANAFLFYGSIMRGEFKFRRQIYDRITCHLLPNYFNSCVNAEVAFDSESGLFRAYYSGPMPRAFTRIHAGRTMRHFYCASDTRAVPDEISQSGAGRHEMADSDYFTIGEYVEVQYSAIAPTEFAWYFGKVQMTVTDENGRYVHVVLYTIPDVTVVVVYQGVPEPVVDIPDVARVEIHQGVGMRPVDQLRPGAKVGGIRSLKEADVRTRFRRILSLSRMSQPGRHLVHEIPLMREDELFKDMAVEYYYTHANANLVAVRDQYYHDDELWFHEHGILYYEQRN
jgi:hypothetical protein